MLLYSTQHSSNLHKIIFLIFLTASLPCFATTQWEKLDRDLYYTQLPSNVLGGKLHAFKFSEQRYHLKLALAKDHHKNSLSVRNFVERNHALLGINGGFFTADWLPLGLRINNYKTKNQFKAISWWGIAFMKSNKLQFSSSKKFKHSHAIKTAIQCGPRLIVQGKPSQLKSGIAERSAICSNKKNEIMLIIANDQPISLTQFATILIRSEKNNGLACYNALNLDGGSSSQLYSTIPNKKIFLPGLSQITDAILIEKN